MQEQEAAAPATTTTQLLLSADRRVTTVHEQDWFTVRNAQTVMNGPVYNRQWAFRNLLGDPLTPNNTAAFSRMSRLDCFLVMFPPKQLTDMVRLTNEELVQSNKKADDTRRESKSFRNHDSNDLV